LTIYLNFDIYYLRYNIKEGYPMKRLKKVFLLLLTLSLVTGSLYSTGWAVDDDQWVRNDPVGQTWSAIDLIVARPLGVAVAIVGTGVFVTSLPFTLSVDIISRIAGSPTSAVNDSAKMFMLKPLKFSFVREFPDEDI
jgi:hypothetical protein